MPRCVVKSACGLVRCSPGALIGGVVLGWALIVWGGQSWNFIYADDALPFVVRIHEGGVHPHHLIIGLLAGLKHFLGWVHAEQFRNTLSMARGFVAGMSCLGIAGVGYLAWLWFGSRWAVIAAMTLTMFSYGFWAYSIVPDFYVPGIAAILWAAVALEQFQRSGRKGWIAVAIFAVYAAALCHQSYVVYAVIATGVLLYHRHYRPAFYLLTSSTILLGASYVLAFALQREYHSFWKFVLGYTLHMQFTPYDRLQPLSLLYAFVGFVRAWTFPEYFVRVGAIGEWVEQRWPMKLFLDERFLLRNISPEVAATLGGIGVASIVLVVLLLIIRVGWVQQRLSTRWSYWSLLGWAGSLLALAVLWEPSSNEFWLWSLPLVALAVSESRSLRERFLWGIAAVGLAVATLPLIWLYHWPDNDIYSVNKRYRLRLQPEDVLITGDFQQTLALNWLYPTQARVFQYELGRIEWDAALQQALYQLAQPSSQGNLILDPLVVMPHPSEMALRQKLPGWNEERLRRVLHRIADFCRGADTAHRRLRGEGVESPWPQGRRRVPLIGIRREGGGVVHFIEHVLPGLEWKEQ